MKTQNRRDFIVTTALLGSSVTASALGLPNDKQKKQQVIHHVFFWLKNPLSKEDLNKLLEGARRLEKIETVRRIHIGIPAAVAARPVLDSSYSTSLLLFFDDLAGQNTYQDHPIHQKFIQDCSPLWQRILVYDAAGV